MTREKFAKFVKKKRIDLDLSQEELAENSGISLKSLSTIETGKKVRVSTLRKLAEHLGFGIEVIEDIKVFEIAEKQEDPPQ